MIRCDGAGAHWSCTPETCRLYLSWPALSLCRYLYVASHFLGGDCSREPTYTSTLFLALAQYCHRIGPSLGAMEDQIWQRDAALGADQAHFRKGRFLMLTSITMPIVLCRWTGAGQHDASPHGSTLGRRPAQGKNPHGVLYSLHSMGPSASNENGSDTRRPHSMLKQDT